MSIYRLNSDLENLEGFGKSLRLRKLEQKYLYMGDGATNYYNDGNVFSVDEGVVDEIHKHKIDFGVSIFDGLNKNTAMISLGAGMANVEKEVLESVGSYVDFYGVDSSDDMIKLLEKNFKNIENEKLFIRADIGSYEFLREIRELTLKYENRVFTFLGNTVGNIENSSVVDSVYNLLSKGDKIWIDVRLRGNGTIEDDMRLFKSYEEAFNTDSGKKFLMSKLHHFGVVDDNANIKIKMETEDLTDSCRFTMSYVFSKKTTVDIKGKITFLKGEVLDIISVHAFSPKGLIDFYEQHGLECIRQSSCHLRGQFLFEKIQ